MWETACLMPNLTMAKCLISSRISDAEGSVARPDMGTVNMGSCNGYTGILFLLSVIDRCVRDRQLVGVGLDHRAELEDGGLQLGILHQKVHLPLANFN